MKGSELVLLGAAVACTGFTQIVEFLPWNLKFIISDSKSSIQEICIPKNTNSLRMQGLEFPYENLVFPETLFLKIPIINSYSLHARNLYSQEYELNIVQNTPNKIKIRIKYPPSLRDFYSHENAKYLGIILQCADSRTTNKYPRNHRFLGFPKEKTRHHPELWEYEEPTQRGPASANTEIQECLYRVRPFYMARTSHMMRGNRSVEPTLKIKTQSHHTFLIRLALTTILLLIDQSTYPFEEFPPISKPPILSKIMGSYPRLAAAHLSTHWCC